jgi:hypothetical protein
MKQIAIILILTLYAMCGYSQTWHYVGKTNIDNFFREKAKVENFDNPQYGTKGQCLENATLNQWDNNGNKIGEKEYRKDNIATVFDEHGNPISGPGQGFVHTMSLFNFSINAKAKTITINNFGDKKSWICVKEMNVTSSNTLEHNQMWVFSTEPGTVKTFDIPLKDFEIVDFGNGNRGIRCTDESTQYKIGTATRSGSLTTYYQATDDYFKGGTVIYQ